MQRERNEVPASRACHPLPIYSGRPPRPIEPDWLAIAESSAPGPEPNSWLLYFLRNSGEILEVLQWESLEIALEHAASIAGVAKSAWSTCEVVVPVSGVIPRSLVPVPPAPAV